MKESFDAVTSELPLMVAIILASISIAVLYILVSTPIYQSDSLIQIEEKKGTTMGGLQQIASALDVTESSTAGEIDIIKSREIVGSAIRDLNLDLEVEVNGKVPFFYRHFSDPAFEVASSSVMPSLSTVTFAGLAWGGQRLELSQFLIADSALERSFKLQVVDASHWRLLGPRDQQLATGEVGSAVGFTVDSKPASIIVGRMNGHPGNTFTIKKLTPFAAYKRISANVKVVETARQSSVVKVTYEDPSPRLAANIVNAISNAYLSQNINRRSQEADKSLQFLEKQLPDTKKAVENAEQAFNSYRLSRHSVDLDKEGETLLAQSVDLEKQRVEGELRKSDLDQRFQPNHPEIVGLNSQLLALKSESARVSEQIARLPETEQEALRLERDVKVNTDLYVALLNNAQQLRISRAGTIGNVNIIDLGLAEDKPVRPMKLLVLLVGAVVGLVLSVIISTARRVLNPTLHDVDALERTTGIPGYATIPASKEELRISKASMTSVRRRPSKVISLLAQVNPGDPAVEALRGMRMGLQFAMVDAPNNVIVITGAIPAQGKTFVASNLAAVLASGGKKVLLVDGDMRKPRVNQYFGLTKSPGLSDVLSETADLGSAIRRGVLPNLDIICAGNIPPNPGELLSRPKFEKCLLELQPQYDVVIVDSAPTLPVGDTLAIARLAGTIFMVLRAEQSTARQFYDSVARLSQVGANVKGIIFNGVRQRRFGYAYRYHYQYRYGS